jgi:hypothetical protein
MSKYKALSNFLADHGGDSWKVSFDHLESLLGISLPRTAREKASWWENDDSSPKPHAKAWLDQGFRTSALDMAGGEVTFVRHRAVGETAAQPGREPDPTAHEVMAAAEAVYEREKAAETAKKVGIVAAALGVLGGVGLVALRLLGKRK